jgi:hypothetical protein
MAVRIGSYILDRDQPVVSAEKGDEVQEPVTPQTHSPAMVGSR